MIKFFFISFNILSASDNIEPFFDDKEIGNQSQTSFSDRKSPISENFTSRAHRQNFIDKAYSSVNSKINLDQKKLEFSYFEESNFLDKKEILSISQRSKSVPNEKIPQLCKCKSSDDKEVYTMYFFEKQIKRMQQKTITKFIENFSIIKEFKEITKENKIFFLWFSGENNYIKDENYMSYEKQEMKNFLKTIDSLLDSTQKTAVCLVIDNLIKFSSEEEFNQLKQKYGKKIEIRIIQSEFEKYKKEYENKEFKETETVKIFFGDKRLKMISQQALNGFSVIASDMWRLFYILNEGTENNLTLYFDVDTWMEYFKNSDHSMNIKLKENFGSPAIQGIGGNDIFFLNGTKNKVKILQCIKGHINQEKDPRCDDLLEFLSKKSIMESECNLDEYIKKLNNSVDYLCATGKTLMTFVTSLTGPRIVRSFFAENLLNSYPQIQSYSYGPGRWVTADGSYRSAKGSEKEILYKNFLEKEYAFFHNNRRINWSKNNLEIIKWIENEICNIKNK